MRTVTLDLPEDVFAFAREEAEHSGATLDETVAGLLRNAWLERKVRRAIAEAKDSPSSPADEAMRRVWSRFESERVRT
ncbi:hypothetical protein BH11ARM2_BH11ARM2_04400 [soil metagenome]